MSVFDDLARLTTLHRRREEAAMARLRAEVDAAQAAVADLEAAAFRQSTDVETETIRHATGTAEAWRAYAAARRQTLLHAHQSLSLRLDHQRAQLAEAAGRDIAVQEMAAQDTAKRRRQRDARALDILDALATLGRLLPPR